MTTEQMIDSLSKFPPNTGFPVLVRLPNGNRVEVTKVAQDAFGGPIICVEASRLCSNCGSLNNISNRYCGDCGKLFPKSYTS